MKKYFFFALILFSCFLFAPRAHAAIAYVQSTSTSVGNPGTAGTFLSDKFKNNVAAGDLIVVGTYASQNAILTATDTLGDKFVTVASSTASGDHDSLILIATTTSAGADTVTISVNGSNFAYAMSIHEYSGTATDKVSDIIDTSSTAGTVSSFSDTVLSLPALTTTQSNEVVFALFVNSGDTGGNHFSNDGAYNQRELNYAANTFCFSAVAGSNCLESEDISLAIATTTTPTSTQADADLWAGDAIAINPGSGGGGSSCSSFGNVGGYAWSNQMGWVALNTCGNLQVLTTTVIGYAWSQNYGWINFGPLPSSTGVTNDGLGDLSGYAWSQGTGYINFQGVTIDSGGVWHGTASGTIAGSLIFDSSTGCSYCNVTTTWRPAGVTQLSVSGVNINTAVGGTNPASIILTANASTSVNINATIVDNTCSQITGGTTTILFYRSAVTSSSCFTGSGNGAVTSSSCYLATLFTASSTCSGGVVNTTTTFPVQYFAQPTDTGSPYYGQNWMATVIFADTSSSKSSADSTSVTSTNDIATLAAINVTTASINYGTLAASSTTGSTNQQTVVQNAGNSTSTLGLSGTALVSGANSIATSSQHYASSSFTYGANEQQLSNTASTVTGVSLGTPTSTNLVSRTIFWGLSVPSSIVSGTYSGTVAFVVGGGNTLGSYYSTTFPAPPAPENPISESGVWINGSSTGLDWTNVQTTSTGGLAYGTQTPASNGADATAVLAGTWGNHQTATGHIHVGTPAADTQEVELRLRTNISPHSITGYEITCSVASTYLSIVRWNGPFANYNVLETSDGAQPRCNNGDTITATASGSLISIYINNAFVTSTVDATYATGSPGMGFFLDGGPASENSNFGYTSFTATST